MTLSLAGTRSSHRWQARPPGNLDTLNTRALYPSVNQWGIPDLEPFTRSAIDAGTDGRSAGLEGPSSFRPVNRGTFDQVDWPKGQPAGDDLGAHDHRGIDAGNAVPARLAPWNSRYAHEHPDPGCALHFFLDDYRFETTWSRPAQTLSRARAYGCALTPDFSLWLEMPPAMQLWQTYRNRWVGAHWQAHGVAIIPTVSWAGEASHDFAFAGIPYRATVAVSTVGCREETFRAGWDAMLDRLDPAHVLVYGRMLPCMAGTATTITRYPSRWERSGKGT